MTRRPALKLDKVLSAMLSHAYDCGGQKGLRYIASAIVACHERGYPDGGGLVEFKLLESMAITMITQFLFLCAFFFFDIQWILLVRARWSASIGLTQSLTKTIPESALVCAKYLRVKRGFY